MRKLRITQTLAGAAGVLLLVAGCSSGGGGNQSVGEDVEESCVPANTFETVKEGVLTVVPYEFLPYAAIENDQIIGVDGEIVTHIAAMECLTIEILPLPAASALEALDTDRADLTLGGWYKTEERGESYGQTDPAWYDFVSMVSKKENGYDTLDSVEGKKIGMVQGSLWVEQSQQLFGVDNVAVYQTPDAAIADVENGRIDVAFVGSGEGSHISAQKESLIVKRMTPDPRLPASEDINGVNYPHKKSNTALTDALNADIATLRGDGTVEEILANWGFTDPQNFQPTS